MINLTPVRVFWAVALLSTLLFSMQPPAMASSIICNGHRLVPNSNLQGATLMNCNFNGVNLSGSNLSYAQIGGWITSANFTGVNFSNAVFTDALITNSNLTRANFSNSTISDLFSFYKDNITGANFSGISAIGAEIGSGLTIGQPASSAKSIPMYVRYGYVFMPYAHFDNHKGLPPTYIGLIMKNAVGTWGLPLNLSHANLNGITLSSIFVSDSSITFSNLSNTDLAFSTFMNSNLTRSSFVNVKNLDCTNSFPNSNLNGTDLTGANCTQSQISQNLSIGTPKGVLP
jgi:uncharacterized protein YjbI with pentapeptide repeats